MASSTLANINTESRPILGEFDFFVETYAYSGAVGGKVPRSILAPTLTCRCRTQSA